MLALALVLFAAQVTAEQTDPKAPKFTARTPDGRVVTPSEEELKTFKEHDKNNDGYITKQVTLHPAPLCNDADLTFVMCRS